MEVTLDYSGSTGSEDFTIYLANPYPIELFRTLHEGLKGQYSEKFVSYRRIINVDFAPVGYDKTRIVWLYGFVKGSGRTLTIGSTTYDVTLLDSDLRFDFQQGTFFGDSFTMKFAETNMSFITDTESTRILKPVVQIGDEGIAGETLSIACNLVDEISVDVVKTDLTFIDQTKQDLSFAYRHIITIDTGPVYIDAFVTWLNEFVQWGSKQIDTSSFYPDGQTYDVVFMDVGIDWQISDGVTNIVSATLTFKEATPRTVLETPAGASPVWDEFVHDEGVFQ